MDYKVKITDSAVKVKMNGKTVFEWDNNANVNYPEDLTWERMIGGVFENAFELGKQFNYLNKKKKEEK